MGVLGALGFDLVAEEGAIVGSKGGTWQEVLSDILVAAVIARHEA